MDAFSLAQYAPDGELLVAEDVATDQLSTRWLGVCRNLLDANGPVFSQSMGDALERFSIECAGPICHFKVNGTVLYSTVMLASPSFANSQQTIAHFADQLPQDASFAAPERFPALLVLNTFAPGVEEADRAALFQLAYHFAGAYFSWLGA